MTLHNLKELMNQSAEQYKEIPAIRYLKGKEIQSKSYQELKEDSESVSAKIDKLGMCGKHFAVIGTSSYGWIVSYFGIVNSNSVAVPLDAALPAEDLWTLINRADVECVFYGQAGVEVAKGLKEHCPKVAYAISVEEEMTEEVEGVQWMSLFDIIENEKCSYDTVIDDHKMCTIMFTSGTTGISKGVMLSHSNFAENTNAVHLDTEPGTISLSVLPIHHAYCLTMDIFKSLSLGTTICLNDSLLHVAKNMKKFQPKIMLLVPLVIESIYKKLQATKLPIPKPMIAKAAFGGNLEIICSGGAYLNPDYVSFFEEYGIQILQGYGMTECSPVISTNSQYASKTGTVGQMLSNCEVKFEDGEILVKGSSVMLGYYKMPEETADVLSEDGWLRTGDLGELDEDGYLKITGRKKNLIILSNGENISPEEIESILGRYEEIQEVIVRENKRVIEAEIFPDYEYLKEQKVEDVRECLQKIIDTYNDGVPSYKRIGALIIREVEFEKNTTKKIKRYVGQK